jgi:23S rRNA (uridine2552-2'-O)-methyltransferase
MERKAKGHVKPTRSNSSNRWMHEHVTDPFVQQAKKLGLRSRASFKIIEIDEKHKLFRRGMTVVDLGAAPGGWSQIAAPKVAAAIGSAKSAAGHVIAIDLLEMPGLPGVEFVQADFTSDEGLATVIAALGKQGKADLVMSDMSPNITGIGISDQAKAIYLCELALDFAAKFLHADGAFVVKCFQGAGFPEFHKAMRATFRQVKTSKPKASRNRSSEMYLVGRGLKA